MTEERSPQLEDGFVRIANELFDAILAYPFTAHQMKVVMSIIRKTYGYGKKIDDMSASQIAAICALSRPHVTSALISLQELRVIHKSPGRFGSMIGINKNYSEWIDPKSLRGGPKKGGSPRTLDAASDKKYHYVYRITNTETGEFYIGARSCDCLPAQDRYIGSGNWIATIDRSNIHKEILATYGSRTEAEAGEISFIRSAKGEIRNVRLYTSTDSVQGSTDSVQGVQNLVSSCTDSVQVDSTDSVHTKDNLPKDNQQKKKPCASADAFARFWSAYPKKKSKVQAEKAFSKIDPSEQLLGAMLAAIGRAKTSDDWTKSGGQFIPYPATWLNQRRWEDEDNSASDGGGWWAQAGFSSLYEAENAGCNQWIAHQWRNGQRMEAHA